MSKAHFAVIGDPVAHSRSPEIHAAFAEPLGIALDYERIAVPREGLAERLAALHDQGYAGLNVTVPHKQAVMPLCSAFSQRAERAGAVNTLLRTDHGWRGDNTDGEGLLRDLQRLGVRVAGQRVLILGAGGAARGIIEPLLAAAPAELVLSSRNPWKPESLLPVFGALGPYRPCTHHALKGDRYDLVINATSIGHAGRFMRLPPELLADGATAYDLNYGPAHAPFAGWARANGADTVHEGLGMLIEQAAAGFSLWHGQAPETGPVHDRLRESARDGA